MATIKEQQPTFPEAVSRGRRGADYLGLERNVVVVSALVFLMGFGEELWKKNLPKYLEALGGLLWKVEPQAPFIIAGVIGSSELSSSPRPSRSGTRAKGANS